MSASASPPAPAYLRPRSWEEALAARAAEPGYLVLAGGTDAMVNANHRPPPAGIIDLWRLPGAGDISLDEAAGLLTIGAGATWLEVQRHPAVLRHASTLAAAAREIGALQIQARGTIGGNVANSSPVGDSLPVLLTLEAELELRSVRGARRVPYHEFCTGYRKTQLGADELLAAVIVPVPAVGTHLFWRKVGTRRAQSISKVMAAAAIQLEHGRVRRAVVAFGAVADRPVRLAAVEAAVVGLAPTAAAEAARAAVAGAISPISDIRSTRDYRLQVAENLAARMFAELA